LRSWYSVRAIVLSGVLFSGSLSLANDYNCLDKRITFWKNVYTVYDKDKAIVLNPDTMAPITVVDMPEEPKKAKKKAREIKKIYGEDVRIQRGIKTKFQEGLDRYESGLGDIVHQMVRDAGMPPEVAILPHVESSYNPKAVSRVKATGLFQIMRFWLKPLGLKNYKQLKDPHIATEAAIKLMNIKHSKIGYWPLTITSWNQGVNAMADAKNKHGNNICEIVDKYDGKRFGYSGRNFYASLLAVRQILEERRSKTWLENASQR